MPRAKFHIRKGDEVFVLSGKEKGKTGTVAEILTSKDRAIVQKLNMVKRHMRPTQKNPSGGITEKEASLHISNLILYDPEESSTVKVRYEVDGEGRKVRVNRQTGKKI